MTTQQTSGCIKERRFLFWKTMVVEHDFQLWCIRKFMFCSVDYEVTYKCKKCAALKTDHFVKGDTLLLKGVSQEVINQIDENGFYFDSAT